MDGGDGGKHGWRVRHLPELVHVLLLVHVPADPSRSERPREALSGDGRAALAQRAEDLGESSSEGRLGLGRIARALAQPTLELRYKEERLDERVQIARGALVA